MIVSRFRRVDLHPATVPNEQMGLIFENFIRRFNELANGTAGDHFTPREVIRLMVNVLFIDDDALLSTAGTVRTLPDPTCGTGGMLAEAQKYPQVSCPFPGASGRRMPNRGRRPWNERIHGQDLA